MLTRSAWNKKCASQSQAQELNTCTWLQHTFDSICERYLVLIEQLYSISHRCVSRSIYEGHCWEGWFHSWLVSRKDKIDDVFTFTLVRCSSASVLIVHNFHNHWLATSRITHSVEENYRPNPSTNIFCTLFFGKFFSTYKFWAVINLNDS